MELGNGRVNFDIVNNICKSPLQGTLAPGAKVDDLVVATVVTCTIVASCRVWLASRIDALAVWLVPSSLFLLALVPHPNCKMAARL